MILVQSGPEAHLIHWFTFTLKVDFFLKNLKVYVRCVHTCQLQSRLRAVQGSKLIENQEVQ